MTGFASWRWPEEGGALPGSVTVRPLTADDRLQLDRIGSDLGDRLHARDVGFASRSLPPDALEYARHGYVVDTANPLVRSGRILVEESTAAPWFGQPGGARTYRFLDVHGRALSVRDLRAFRVLVDVPIGPAA